MDLIMIDWTLSLQIGIFLFLVIFLSNVLFKPVVKVLEVREEMHLGPNRQAKTLKEEVVSLNEQIGASIAEVRKQADVFRSETMSVARKTEGEILAESRNKADDFLKKSRGEMDAQVSEASAKLRAEGDRIGALLAQKVLSSAGQGGAS